MEEVPVIDVAALRGGSPTETRELAASIGAAARGIGFFTIRNHGIDPVLTARMFAAAAEFFALPDAEKDSVTAERATDYVGYHRMKTESADRAQPVEYKESFGLIGERPINDPEVLAKKPFVRPNRWPALPGFRDVMTSYFEAVRVVADALHRIIAVDVGTDPDALARHFERPLSLCSVLRYPPHPGPFDGVRYGAAPHTDFGGLTLLAQDGTPGLEVRRRDGGWVAVEPVLDTLVCNIGDALMRWTNDVYVSNQHRVVNRSGRDRFSAAFFCDPNGDTEIAAFPSCVSAERPAKYPPILYEELLRARLERRPVAAL